MRVGQTSAIVFVSKIIASALGFLGTLYFARTLGSEIYGLFALVIALVSWFKIGGNLGTSVATTKRISEGREQGAYASSGLVVQVFFAAILSGIILIASPLIEQYVGRPVTHYVVLLLLISLGNITVNGILNGQHSVHIVGILGPLKITLRTIAQLVLVIAGMELYGMLAGQAIGAAIILFVGTRFLKIRFTKPSLRHFRELYDYAKYSWLGGVTSQSFRNIDILVLGLFVQPSLVGIYSISWTISSFLATFDSAISKAIFPEISSLSSQNDTEAVSTLITDSLQYGGLILIPGLVGSVLLDVQLLQIYGEEFGKGAAVLWLLTLATLLYGYYRQLLTSLNAIDRPDLSFRINLVFIASNVLGNVFLVTSIGWVGAAVATAGSAAIALFLTIYLLYQQIEFKFPYSEISKQVFAALVMGVVVYLGRRTEGSYLLIENNFATVLCLVLAGAVTYFVVLSIISKEFRTTVGNNFSPKMVSLLR